MISYVALQKVAVQENVKKRPPQGVAYLLFPGENEEITQELFIIVFDKRFSEGKNPKKKTTRSKDCHDDGQPERKSGDKPCG